jgi:hypothetical protein
MDKNRTRLVVSFTTIPKRIENIPHVLEELMKQSRPPDMIYLGIARNCRRNNEPYDFTKLEKKFFEDYPFKVVILKEDYGAVCKILGGLFSEKDPNTLIVSLDDDFALLPTDLLKSFEYHYLNIDKNVVWATRGKQLGKGLFQYGWTNYNQYDKSFLDCKVEDGIIQVISGYMGVAYPRKFFPFTAQDWKENFFTFGEIDCLRMHDDVWISAFLSYRGVKAHQLQNATLLISEFEMENRKDGLSNQKISFIRNYFQAVNEAKKLGAFQYLEPISNPHTTLTFGLLVGLFGLSALTAHIIYRRKKEEKLIKKNKK